MYNNNWHAKNQYRQTPYENVPCCYRCPAMQNQYGSYPIDYDSFYRTAHEEDFINTNYYEFNRSDRNFNMTRDQIENVAAAVKKESPNLLKDIGKYIKDSRLLDYLLLALITYVCNNYYKYKDIIDEKTDELVDELKVNLPWVFDILKVFGITTAMVDDFLDNLIKSTVLSLKKFIPAGL
jgi:hypothetical protein